MLVVVDCQRLAAERVKYQIGPNASMLCLETVFLLSTNIHWDKGLWLLALLVRKILELFALPACRRTHGLSLQLKY